ncbi:MAG: C39 family peptidase [Verrucomicrobiae bacterium]|nr:C39 family peptidase [Verrucomicrobiae bacterium]
MMAFPMTRRHWLAGALGGSAAVSSTGDSHAQSGPIVAAAGLSPAFPVSALTDTRVWDDAKFREAFLPRQSPTRIVHRYWPAPVTVLGRQPHAVVARCRDGMIDTITLLFLDSGTHFGYVPKSQAQQTEAENSQAFQALFAQVSTGVRSETERLASGPAQSLSLGREPMLSQAVSLFRCGNVIARLHSIEEQLVKVVLFRDEATARNWFDPEELERKGSDRAKTYARAVINQPNGDTLLDDIPVLPQGDRAYCGVSSLAMAMQSLGLWLDTEDYAAAAGIRYGSTRGSHIRETYEAAASEAGFRLSRATRYDHDKVIASIDAGLPVLVWRRWTQERDYLHSMFLRKLAKDPESRLPEPDATDRASWPDKDAYNHSSVITGYNTERREVIFSESWSEMVRNRRMRPEEMEGTAYYTFLLRL